MTNDKRGKVEPVTDRYDVEWTPEGIRLNVKPDGAHIGCDDHERIVATLAAENQALVARLAYLERHAYWSDARDFAPGGSWAAYVHAPTGRPTFTQAVDAAIAKEAGNG